MITTEDGKMDHMFAEAREDLLSITRAHELKFGDEITFDAITILDANKIKVSIEL